MVSVSWTQGSTFVDPGKYRRIPKESKQASFSRSWYAFSEHSSAKRHFVKSMWNFSNRSNGIRFIQLNLIDLLGSLKWKQVGCSLGKNKTFPHLPNTNNYSFLLFSKHLLNIQSPPVCEKFMFLRKFSLSQVRCYTFMLYIYIYNVLQFI